MTNEVRIIRYQGITVRDADVINWCVMTNMPRDAAERHVAKAPTSADRPVDGVEFARAMDRLNRDCALRAIAASY